MDNARETGSAASAADNLTTIYGIGPTVVAKLAVEGITTFRQLADISDERADDLDLKLNLRGKMRAFRWREAAADIVNPPVEKPEPEPEPLPIPPARPSEDTNSAVLAEALALIKEMRKQPDTVSAPIEETSTERERRRLHKERHYSNVFGDHMGAAFMQIVDGTETYFNALGVEMFPGESAEDAIEYEAEPEYMPSISDFSHETALNWLDRKIDLDFPFVKVAVRQKFNATVRSEKEARQYLHGVLRMRARG